MKNKRRITTGLWVLLNIAVPAFGAISETQCGGDRFIINSPDSIMSEDPYKIYYKLNGKKNKFVYKINGEIIYAACVEDYHSKKYLLLESICSGSGCIDAGEFVIIDAQTKKVLLDQKPLSPEDEIGAPPEDDTPMRSREITYNHVKRNWQDAEKILGYAPPEIRLIHTFCCKRPQKKF